jgi:hypothetical protein
MTMKKMRGIASARRIGMKRALWLPVLVCGLAMLCGCGAKPSPYRTVLPTDPNFVAAQELRLKVREMADQLLAGMPNEALNGFAALPTSFVSQDDFSRSSPFGRYLAEALIYEFNQRGFPVREYRVDGTITMNEATGETALTRKGKVATAKIRGNALLVGTYHQDPDVIFVNARLVRSSDGIVLRTAQVMLAPNAVTLRMSSAPPADAEERRKRAENAFPAPGKGPLFAHVTAPQSGGGGGMRIRQAPPRKADASRAAGRGLTGYPQ